MPPPFFSGKQHRDCNTILGAKHWIRPLFFGRSRGREDLEKWFPKYPRRAYHPGDEENEANAEEGGEEVAKEVCGYYGTKKIFLSTALMRAMRKIGEEDGAQNTAKKIATRIVSMVEEDSGERNGSSEDLSKKAADVQAAVDETVILQNLSKRVYVRSDTLSVTGSDAFCGLGRVLMARICWSSSDTGTSQEYKGGLHRGKWAGDRFDIIKLRDLDSSAGKWEDVTKEVRADMLDLYNCNNQERWW